MTAVVLRAILVLRSGKTPIAKNGDFGIMTRGMTPIEKNIRVVDEQGNELEATYPKRAKGLVKNGRARFIDEKTILLVCPPQTEEETKMATEPTYTVEYALAQLEKIQTESAAFAEKVFKMIAQNTSAGPGDVGAQGNGQALEALAREHEATAQRLIDVYRQMIDNLKPKTEDIAAARFRFLDFIRSCTALTGDNDNCTAPDYEAIWKTMMSSGE